MSHAISLSQLVTELTTVADRWTERWPGLPSILNMCLKRLELNADTTLAPRTQAIANCLLDLCEWIEKNGQSQATRNQEPAYHNRLHFADTMISLSYLLIAQRQWQTLSQSPLSESHIEWVSLLSMLAHDLMHDGKTNRYPQELEQRSVNHLKPFMNNHGLDQADQVLITQLILHTDANSIIANHARIKIRAFDLNDPDCLTILITESDILASCLSATQTVRTQNLYQEWLLLYPEQAQQLLQPKNRLLFLERIALFSSPASKLLTIDQDRQSQIDAIQTN